MIPQEPRGLSVTNTIPLLILALGRHALPARFDSKTALGHIAYFSIISTRDRILSRAAFGVQAIGGINITVQLHHQ
ncbi:hypothetical protein BDN71DRAFT_1447874 [Pleurotus eryngii]|uniref:Uncharacterized protein n=1 Tax=Pleurotus eryngii TaxID=5323 RepID=A0A9P5ZXD7_PLEER|nr:hypothetical protein BDN71DRAFT_1447874 [Pleurotus eryngii]